MLCLRNGLSRMTGTVSKNGMQLTGFARCAPFAIRSCGQSLSAAFAIGPGVTRT